MFPYVNELTPFETDRFRELIQTARVLNNRECISSYIPVFRWNKIEIVLQFIIYEDILMISKGEHLRKLRRTVKCSRSTVIKL